MSPAQLASRSDVLFTMLGYPDDVGDVVLAADGALHARITDVQTAWGDMATALEQANGATSASCSPPSASP